MRLGGPVFVEGKDPEAYVAAHVQKGYRAAYCPGWINADTDPEICAAFRTALARHDLVLAEVGIWQNVLSHNRDEARAAMEYSVRRLQTAEELDARCAVNIVGSWCTTHWDGPHESHYSRDFFDAAVEAARKVIDAVKPKRTKMTFEVMPCQFIDSAAEYMRFLKAVDREAAGVHLDPANSIANPRILYGNGDFFRNEFEIFGQAVVSIHLKDVCLDPSQFTVNIREVPIGKGNIDYVNLLRLIDRLPPDTPGMLEHLDTEELYDESAAALRALAGEAGVRFR